jgi:hypothetical protein
MAYYVLRDSVRLLMRDFIEKDGVRDPHYKTKVRYMYACIMHHIDKLYVDRLYVDRLYVDRLYVDRLYVDRLYVIQNGNPFPPEREQSTQCKPSSSPKSMW